MTTATLETETAGRWRMHKSGKHIGSEREQSVTIATGTRARQWFNPTEAALEGVYTIRTSDDAARLQAALAARPARVLIIGAGFIGSEVASICRERGLAVTVAELGSAPLVGALGGVIGAIAAEMQRDHGVDLRCGVGVTSLEGDASGHVRRAQLSDGTTVDADVVLASLGSIRNTEWLQGAGLAAGFWGVGCDAGCRVLDINGVVTDSIYVAGDIARAPHPLYDYPFLSMEHWDNAVLGAEVAAHNMVSLEADRWPHLLLPNFWSGQFGVNIKSVGVCSFGDEIVFTQGSAKERRFAAAYGHRGRIVAAVTFDHAKWLEYYAALIERQRQQPGPSLLSELATDHGPDGPMSPVDMVDTGSLLLIAGHETTVNLITNGMLTLLRHPDVLERLRREPDLVIRLVEELLRYEPPVHTLPNRWALADIDIAGTTIPRGSHVILLLASGNRDPARFRDPDRFDPDREDNQHLGFGSGIHHCFGAPLARLEAQIALPELARRLENPRLVQDPPPYRQSAILRGPRPLLVEIDGVRD